MQNFKNIYQANIVKSNEKSDETLLLNKKNIKKKMKSLSALTDEELMYFLCATPKRI